MARLTGLFQRGGSYYLRIVLPNDHPLRDTYRNGRYVQTLGPSGYREAILNGTRKRAEVLAGYKVPQSQPGAAVAPAKAVYWSWTCPVSTDGLKVLDLLGIFNQIDLTVAVN